MKIVSENLFSGKTYFYTIASRPKKAQEEETSAVVAEADGAAAEGGDGEAAGEEGAGE